METIEVIQCDGYRRHGGAFTLGPVQWVRCSEDAIVHLKLDQQGEVSEFPACKICWEECHNHKDIKILEASPINIGSVEKGNVDL